MEKPNHSQVNNQSNEEKPVILYPIRLNLSNTGLSANTIIALEDLGNVLLSIHKRMKSEGFEIRDGCIKKILM